MKKFFEEFKAFITKGNVIDMAVAVIIGGAFNKIVTSLVNDIVMPLVSTLMNGVNVTDWKWVIKEAVYDAKGVELSAETALLYGNFIQMIIEFLIIAFSIFVALKVVLAFKERYEKAVKALSKKQEEEAAEEDAAEENTPAPETTEDILKDIRTLLEKQNKK